MCGVDSIWTMAVDAVRNAMLHRPSATPTTNANAWFGATAMTAMAAP
jgi:hypothetical protein